MVKDHLGNEFKNVTELCRHYGIDVKTFKSRIERGMNIEDAVKKPETIGFLQPPFVDHLGKEYKSINAMCKAYNMNRQTLRYRINAGYTLERALTLEIDHANNEIRNNERVEDHKGNKFASYKDMCEHYNISVNTFYGKRQKGMSIKEILEPEKKVEDHEGNKFLTIGEMCRYWNVSETAYYKRINNGWSLKDALVGRDCNKVPHKNNSIKCEDHKGNKFASISEMCDYWNISTGTYYGRIKDGWTKEEALSTASNEKCKKVVDHKGNNFNSVKELCDSYSIDVSTYRGRISNGWSMERALTADVETKLGIYDHKGIYFKSKIDMCKYYNISITTFNKLIKEGIDLADILNGEYKKKILDHLGNEYESVNEMCEYYGISYATYYSRLKSGRTLEEALTEDVIGAPIECEDHLGNKFSSISKMCKHWNISVGLYLDRIKAGKTIEEALTMQKRQGANKECEDHLGNKYKTETEMCKAYGLSPMTYRYRRIKLGWSLQKSLETKSGEITYKNTVYDFLGNEYFNRTEMCKAYNINLGKLDFCEKRGYSIERCLFIADKGVKLRQGTVWNGVKILEVVDNEHIKVSIDDKEFVVTNIQLAQLCLSRHKEGK